MASLLHQARQRARDAAANFRLPFRRTSFHGAVGNWAGTGVGSSIDFQDHRAYVPGDDPRYIDWQAYARSGTVTMKLYREEVSPAVDLVFDASKSMCFEPQKKMRSLELFFFAVESALANGSSLRCWIDAGTEKCLVATERLREELYDPFSALPSQRDVEADTLIVPLRSGSLRVVVSDCLLPGASQTLPRRLSGSKGRATLLVPTIQSEASPDWLGNLELVDCEDESARIERFDEERLEAYRRAYRRHFELWEESCRRLGIAFARVPAEAPLGEALGRGALRRGAVEPCH